MDMKSKNPTKPKGKHSGAATASTSGVKSAVGQNMDGFFRAPHMVSLGTAARSPKTLPKLNRTPNHAQAHKPQAPKTLMRSSVQRPAESFKQQASVQASLQHKVPSLIVPKSSVASVDPERLTRATSIQRSPHIARHHTQSSHPIAVQLAPLTVQPAPDKPTSTAAGAPAPQPHNKPIDIFEHAVANASNYVDTQAHRTHFTKHARRHLTSMAAGTLALLVIAGFAAYQNTPGLQFKVASVQAGVATHMPNFQAAGFAYTGVRSSNGKLTVGFSGSGAQFQMTQQATNWSSQDMIQNISSTDASGTPNYTTVNVQGMDVYRLSNNTATWVSNGKWYQVTGNGALNDSQIKALVANT